MSVSKITRTPTVLLVAFLVGSGNVSAESEPSGACGSRTSGGVFADAGGYWANACTYISFLNYYQCTSAGSRYVETIYARHTKSGCYRV